MANINKIKLSGTTYNIQDLNASKTVELTQAQYDALTVKDPNTFYIITDAQGADLSQYYTSAQTESAITQAVSGKLDTSTFDTYSGSVETALSGKQDTLSAGTGIDITDNVISATGGGGKSIVGGRGITVTTGETADTVSFNLPISAGTGTNSIILGSGTASQTGSLVHGIDSQSRGTYSNVFGYNCDTNSNYGFTAGGYLTNTFQYGARFGKYNNNGSNIFEVGNGFSFKRHNAFEIRENGDIYIADTNDTETTHYYDKPMIKLQDSIGGTSYSAGTGIDITNDVISVTGKQDTLISGTNIKTINNESLLGSGNIVIQGGGTISIDQTVISGSTNAVAGGAVYNQLGGMKIVKLTESEYAALVTKYDDTLYCVVPDTSN